MPHMNDPYFKQSVIFMCEHDKNGAMGLIINKPFNDKMINDIFYPIHILPLSYRQIRQLCNRL